MYFFNDNLPGVSETEDPLKVASATDEETEENFEDTVVDSGCIEDKVC